MVGHRSQRIGTLLQNRVRILWVEEHLPSHTTTALLLSTIHGLQDNLSRNYHLERAQFSHRPFQNFRAIDENTQTGNSTLTCGRRTKGSRRIYSRRIRPERNFCRDIFGRPIWRKNPLHIGE